MQQPHELWLYQSIIVKLLRENGANFNNCADNLTFADWISHEHSDTYVYLVSLGADEDILKAVALKEVAKVGDIEALKFLIDRDVDVNSTHCLLESSTALIAAVESNQWNIVDYLITAHADVNQQDADGRTALMYAVICCSMTLSKKLLLAGASKELKDKDGNTALDLAVDRQDKVLIKLLK
jgi:uncharacterized protein